MRPVFVLHFSTPSTRILSYYDILIDIDSRAQLSREHRVTVLSERDTTCIRSFNIILVIPVNCCDVCTTLVFWQVYARWVTVNKAVNCSQVEGKKPRCGFLCEVA